MTETAQARKYLCKYTPYADSRQLTENQGMHCESLGLDKTCAYEKDRTIKCMVIRHAIVDRNRALFEAGKRDW
ncbi:hypothetical protein HN935_02980 [archaeon]|nr:hypothetical protein [archaeon]